MMKYFLIYLSFFFNMISIHTTIYAEGFTAGTLIHTTAKLIPIEELISGQDIISVDNFFQQKMCVIANTYYHIADSYVDIDIENIYIHAAPNQRFYSITKQQWVTADTLNSDEILLCCNNKSVRVNSTKLVLKHTKFYTLSVHESHTYCISPYEIVTHNFEPTTLATTATISIIFPPAAPILIGIQTIIGSAIAGIGCYMAYKKHKQKKATFAQIVEEVKSNNCNNNNPKKPEDDEDEHPHGIYKGASYHHPNSRYDKSPSPQDGQKCLDYSLPYLGKQRIAIEENTFVILKQTSHRLFHGHLIEWKKIAEHVQKMLIKQGYVTSTGKIIKQITTKVLS